VHSFRRVLSVCPDASRLLLQHLSVAYNLPGAAQALRWHPTFTCVIPYLPASYAGANLAWQHVQHQESLPDARARSHDLRSLRHVPQCCCSSVQDLAKLEYMSAMDAF